MHHLLRERMRLLPFTALLCALFLLMVACAPAHRKTTPDAGLELRLLHVNDTHAFLAGIDEHMNACFEAADCRGGLARISAAIQTARQEQDNVIALDAGDQFQGTLFYSVNKWPVIAAADALLPYDAMTLGNHEFDEGCRELARFLEAQPLPVLAANLTPQQGCPLAGSRILPYLVRTVRGTRVGIIGLANDEVTGLAAACPRTTFRDARTTLQQYVAELEAQGIRHIIIVTHLGLERDRELARSVPYCDIDLKPYEYDMAKAARILDEAGWKPGSDGIRQKDGKRMELGLLYNSNSVTEKTIAEYLQHEYGKLGIKVSLRGEEEQSYRDNMKNGLFDMIFNICWGMPYDPQSSMAAMRQRVYGDYAAQLSLPDKAQIDAAITEIMSSTDPVRRQELFTFALTHLHEDAIYIPLTYETNKALFTKRLKGVGFNQTQYEVPFTRMYFEGK